MVFLEELLSNHVLIASLTAWFLAQLIKTILTLIVSKKLQLERMFGAGGMPSAHSATVCALTVSVSRVAGVASTEFAIAVLFAAVVMYDAMGVRRAAGEHAKVINALLDEWDEQLNGFIAFYKKTVKNNPLLAKLIPPEASENAEKPNDNSEQKSADKAEDNNETEDVKYPPIKHTDARGKEFELDNIELKEFLGHTPIEVLAGALLGITVALILPK